MSFGSGRGRGRGSRPGPPSWPHGTAPKDRGKFASNKFVETCEPPEVDWDEIRHQVSEVVINLEVTQGLHPLIQDIHLSLSNTVVIRSLSTLVSDNLTGY